MTPRPCPDCAHRLACSSGARLVCVAALKRDKARETERDKMRKWNEKARGK